VRSAQALECLTSSVRKTFDADVAEALIADAEMFDAAARLASSTSADELDAIVSAIAQTTDDGLSDWLVETADSPAGWLYGQLNQHL
jgi:hypothetical protein